MSDKKTYSVKALFQVQVTLTVPAEAVTDLRSEVARALRDDQEAHPLRDIAKNVPPWETPDEGIITDVYLPVLGKIMQGEIPDFAFDGTAIVLDRVQHELIPPTKEPEPGTQVLVLDKRQA